MIIPTRLSSGRRISGAKILLILGGNNAIMNNASLFFHGSLTLFLLRQRRDRWIEHAFDGQPSVKDMVESLGVPHPEIEHIVVNGQGVDFNRLVRDGDRIEVYPAG